MVLKKCVCVCSVARLIFPSAMESCVLSVNLLVDEREEQNRQPFRVTAQLPAAQRPIGAKALLLIMKINTGRKIAFIKHTVRLEMHKETLMARWRRHTQISQSVFSLDSFWS